MHHTPEQKKTLQSTWMVSVAIAIIFSILFYLNERSSGNISNGIPFLVKVIIYTTMLINLLAWSWDWIVTRNYPKAGMMLALGIGIMVVKHYLSKSQQYRLDNFWEYLKYYLLFSEYLWFAVARAIVAGSRQQAVSALLTGIVLTFIMPTFNQGRFGITALTLPFLVIVEYLLREGWMFNITRFLMGQFMQTIMGVALTAANIVIVQWALQLFGNLNSPAEREGAKNIFGKAFPVVSGRYFAIFYPVFFVLTICCFSSAVINLLYILKGPGYVEFDIPGAQDIPLFMMQNVKQMPYILFPLHTFFAIKTFQLLHTLVMGRCIALNKKFGLGYLFCFVPVLNLVPWLKYSLEQTPTDEHARLQYATEMNDPNQQRSTGTINLLIILSVLNFVLGMLTGTSGLAGFLGVLIMLTALIMYIAFVYRPSMIYGVITIKALVLLMLIFFAKGESSYALVLSIYTVYSIFMLFWQKRIFFPDIIIPVDMQLDGEAEINTVKDPGNL